MGRVEKFANAGTATGKGGQERTEKVRLLAGSLGVGNTGRALHRHPKDSERQRKAAARESRMETEVWAVQGCPGWLGRWKAVVEFEVGKGQAGTLCWKWMRNGES